MQAVKKTSPVKTALCVLIPIVIIVSLILVFIFVDFSNNGTYYAVENGKISRDSFITIKNGKWSDENGDGGEYKKNNGKLTFYVEFFDETMEYATGTVEDHMLILDMGSFEANYVSKKHKHSYGAWQELVKMTCTNDGLKTRECKCGCINQITTALKLTHEYGGWVFDGTSHWKVCRFCNNEAERSEHNDGDNCDVCGCPRVDTVGLSYTLNSDGTSYSVSGIGSVTNTIIRIPASYNNLPVTAIGYSAFSSERSLKGIIIPDSVISIGDYAFYDCNSLASITIPDSVTYIGHSAFHRCSSLTTITISNSVTSIGGSTFMGCSSLKSVTIPDGVTEIGEDAFGGCSSLTSITIPDGVTEISREAFSGCSPLKSVTIPESVTEIGTRAFNGCDSLTDINFKGTKEQWNAISKGSFWDYDTNNYTIHCTDGDM